jgi:hypothetical protein
MKFKDLLPNSRFILAHRRKNPRSEQSDRRSVYIKLDKPVDVLRGGGKWTYNAFNIATGRLASIKPEQAVLEVVIQFV